MSEYAVTIPSDEAILSATLNQQVSPPPQVYVNGSQSPTHYGQPQYAQPQYAQPQVMNGQPQYGQPQVMNGQPQYMQPNGQPQYMMPNGQPQYMQPNAQYVQPVMVKGPGSGLLDAQGVPNAQQVMTTAGAVTVGMPQPTGVDCTPGLEYLSALDQIWIKELPQLVEQFTNFEANQKFQCLNNEGQQVYYSQENTGTCTRQCLGSYRPFHIDVFTPTGQIAMQLDRPFRCNSVCVLGCLPLNWCFLQDLVVADATGGVIGHVVQKPSLRPFFDLVDNNGTVLCHIVGPWMMHMCSCFSDIVFNIYEPNTTENPVGTLTKKYGGFVREALLSNADNFACVFPMKMSVTGKALIFAATYLIDFMYFEDKKKKDRLRVEQF